MLGRRLTAALAAAALLGAAAILSAGPATATFPGKNGRIVYSLKLTGKGADIYSVGANGGKPTKLTTSPRGDVRLSQIDPAL